MLMIRLPTKMERAVLLCDRLARVATAYERTYEASCCLSYSSSLAYLFTARCGVLVIYTEGVAVRLREVHARSHRPQHHRR